MFGADASAVSLLRINLHQLSIFYIQYLRCSTRLSCCPILVSCLRCKAYYRQVRNATDAEIASCSTLPILLIRGDPCKLHQIAVI